MSTRFGVVRTALSALGLLVSAAAVSAAQTGSAYATRERLEQELARLEREGGGHSSAAAALIRVRLQSGDFQPGDRIYLRVEGEAQLTDTFTVAPGPELVLPQIGALPLGGVLRTEFPARLQTFLARYLRDPVVQIRPLIRVLVEGEVLHPGFYGIAPQQPLTDVITAAGGFTPRSKAAGIRIERDRATIWGGAALQQALSRGDSFDLLNLRAGDRVVVPARGDSERTIRILGILVTIPLAVFAISRAVR